MKNDETDSIPLKGDRALESVDDDRLGFRDLAGRIATSLVDQTLNDGMVIGIEGAWGSGKSSLLFLVREELKTLPKKQRPSVIDFRPWLIGNRDALIASLFGELSSQLDHIKSSKAKKASEALQSFRDALSPAGVMLEAIGEDTGSVAVRLVGRAVKAVGGSSPPPQLSVLKEELAESLKDINHRFIITIDDVDRLEPREVIEILRLVRSVVDLPNVIYLLCYDRGVLVESIKEAIKIQDGETYLEKIVQLPVIVPKPEPLQLRRWFSEDLKKIASVKNDNESARLSWIIYSEGGRQLRTPRSVIRVLNAIRFFWPPLREARADLADLVWLQLIKDGNPALYEWIQDYCAIFTTLSSVIARPMGNEKPQNFAKLKEVAPNLFKDVTYRHHFARQLPGAYTTSEGHQIDLFGEVSERERDEAIRNKRLSSPYHYSLYFSFSQPSHALTNDEFASMWVAMGAGAEETGESFLHFDKESKTISLTKADIWLECMKGGGYETLSANQCENFLVALSQVMDEIYRYRPLDHLRHNSLQDKVRSLLLLVLSRLEQLVPERREPVLSAMFSCGKALDWLTSLFRQETNYGRHGEQSHPEGDRLVTDTELDCITEILLKRYRTMSAGDIFGHIRPHQILFAWGQAGDEQEPRQFIKSHTESSEGFIEALEGLSREIHNADRGSFKVLKKSDISYFMDYSEAVRRVRELKDHADLGQRACRLEERIKEGVDHD